MVRIRRKHSAEFKLKAVIKTLKGEKTAAQLEEELQVHPIPTPYIQTLPDDRQSSTCKIFFPEVSHSFKKD